MMQDNWGMSADGEEAQRPHQEHHRVPRMRSHKELQEGRARDARARLGVNSVSDAKR